MQPTVAGADMNLSGKSWGQLGGELATATDRDFERAALPLLRALWPAMVQPRGLAAYDRAGVDLLALGKGDRIECVVQCKGFFKVEGLTDDQLGQITKSITKFRRSGLITDTFVLLHNQDGRNASVAAKVDAALKELVTAGVARTVHQWDRFAFLAAIKGRLREMVADRVSEQSSLMLAQMDRQFRYGRTYVPEVPVSHEVLTLRRGSAPSIKKVRKTRRIAHVADALAASKGRWTLLLGLFGSGKTTAALHAAGSSPRRMLYVHAGALGDAMHHGTHAMMARILDALAVFGDFEADDRALFGRLASPLLRQFLSGAEAGVVLILDALDENRFLGSPEGASQFASALAELTCPIVLTTRLEHFRSTFGNFDHLFEELSVKGGNMGDIALLRLECWETEQIEHLVSACAAEDPANVALGLLAADLLHRRSTDWPTELLAHPLFLRMIIDLTAEDVPPSSRRADLIRDWVWAKLTRDMRSGRALPVEVADRNDFLERMESSMEGVAAAMLAEADGTIELVETLPSGDVITIIESALQTTALDLGRALAVSLLMPTDVRFRGAVPVRFSHRIFQEYFLARHFIGRGLALDGLPDVVRALADDIAAGAD